MQAIVLGKYGGTENLLYKEIDKPQIKVGEVLIKTKAIGLNPVDYKTRQGQGAAKRLTLPIILGWDVSGLVIKSKSSKFKIGDSVFGLINFPGQGKTYAEFVAASEKHLSLMPENISFNEAAAVPLAGLTAYQALIKTAGITVGSKVLINGASGGVGHLAIQLAKIAGAEVLTIASSRNKNFVLEMGADQFFDYKQENFAEKIKDIDCILDCVGGQTLPKLVKTLKPGKTVISLPEPVSENLIKENPDIRFKWVLVESNKNDLEQISEFVRQGKLKVYLDKIFPFRQILEAHNFMEKGSFRGKLVAVM